jgi:hypothetical protein
VIRIATAAVLAVAASALLLPYAAGAKPAYTATCDSVTHDVTLTWPGGTDITETKGTLIWPNDVEESVSYALPKKGGVQTNTWHYLGTHTGQLVGVEVQFLRKSSYFPPPVGVMCTP